MAQSDASFFIDDAAVAAMTTRVPDAEHNSGMFGGSNCPGLGISTENPGLEQSLPSWTLLDQHGNARAGQIGQLIGGDGITETTDWPGSGGTEGTAPDATIRLMPPANLPTNAEKWEFETKRDGELSFPAENATLNTLATGWESAAGAFNINGAGNNVYIATGNAETGDSARCTIILVDTDGQEETDVVDYTVGADTSPEGIAAEFAALIDALVHVRAESAGPVMTITPATPDYELSSNIVRT